MGSGLDLTKDLDQILLEFQDVGLDSVCWHRFWLGL